MSNVRKNRRSAHRFLVCDKALDLYEHTVRLIANDRIFDRAYKSLIDDIELTAMKIYHLCRVANDDLNARDKEEAAMRIKLEGDALDQCAWLKTYIFMAEKTFHLRASKVCYWNGLLRATKDMISSWRRVEIEHYKEIFGAVGYSYSAQNCFRRSANRTNANNVWNVNTSGNVNNNNAYNANRCAPSVHGSMSLGPTHSAGETSE